MREKYPINISYCKYCNTLIVYFPTIINKCYKCGNVTLYNDLLKADENPDFWPMYHRRKKIKKIVSNIRN